MSGNYQGHHHSIKLGSSLPLLSFVLPIAPQITLLIMDHYTVLEHANLA